MDSVVYFDRKSQINLAKLKQSQTKFFDCSNSKGNYFLGRMRTIELFDFINLP